ncbi:hypothetical protein D3C75_1240790 [compost metagenome]
MNGSWVMAKMAGTLSTANTRSASSISTSARNSGVAYSTVLLCPAALRRTKKRGPCRSSVTRKWPRTNLSTGLLARSGWASSRENSIFIPVTSKKAPNT